MRKLSEEELNAISPEARAQYLKTLERENDALKRQEQGLAKQQEEVANAQKAPHVFQEYRGYNERKSLAPLFICEILMNAPGRKFHKTELAELLKYEPYGIDIDRRAVSRHLKALAGEKRYHITNTKGYTGYKLEPNDAN